MTDDGDDAKDVRHNQHDERQNAADQREAGRRVRVANFLRIVEGDTAVVVRLDQREAHNDAEQRQKTGREFQSDAKRARALRDKKSPRVVAEPTRAKQSDAAKGRQAGGRAGGHARAFVCGVRFFVLLVGFVRVCRERARDALLPLTERK